MKEYDVQKLKLLNIQIGCALRLARLKRGLSQHDLALFLNSNPTMIGRIERAENNSSWDKLYSISQALDVNFCKLFNLKSKADLLLIVEESLKLENKLTSEKKQYYSTLNEIIEKEYNLLKE